MMTFPMFSEGGIRIIAATKTLPITVTTERRHQLTSGDRVRIIGASDMDALNGRHKVTVTGPTTFTIPRAGNADYLEKTAGLLDSPAHRSTYPAGVTVNGSIHQMPRTISGVDTGRFVAHAKKSLGTDPARILLEGRPDPVSGWILVSDLGVLDTWTQGSSGFQAAESGVVLYPEMRISTEAQNDTTNEVTAWLIV